MYYAFNFQSVGLTVFKIKMEVWGNIPRGSGDLAGFAVTDLGSFNASLPSTYAASAQTAFVTTSPSLPRHQENVLSHLPLVHGLLLGALQSRFFSRQSSLDI